MTRSAVLELHKGDLRFSAGHFMLYSATERESMHGHDYQLHVALNTLIKSNGMAFDYRIYKQKLLKICESLDYRFILPSQSDYLRLEETDSHWIAHFDQYTIPFLKRDAVVLPICNVTLEELSNWFIQQLTANMAELDEYGIQGITIKVFNGRGESGSTAWGKF